MKLVAASKLNKAQKKMEQNKPFYKASQILVDEEFPRLPVDAEGKEIELDEETLEAVKKSRHLIVAVTSDRGLCGAANSSVVRTAKKLAALNPQGTTFALIGDKAVSGLTAEYGQNFKYSVSGVSGNTKTSFVEITQIADAIWGLEWDRLTVVHNSFVSVLVLRTCRRMFVSKEAFLDLKRWIPFEVEAIAYSEFREENLTDYYSWVFSSFLYSTIIEGQACELGSRMTSMDSATTNAGDVISKLTIKYNKSRQAGITTELTEIVSGAAAIQAMDDRD